MTLMALAFTSVTASAQPTAAAATTAAQGANDAKLSAQKTEAAKGVDELGKLAQEMVDSVFSYGELGMQEVETSKYLTAQLEKFGFKVTRGQSGMPTAWVATWGSGKPVIALGSDIDGIPQASQKPGVAYHDPLIEGAPGHGEGHNTGMPLNIVAAIAVKKIMERDKLPGTLMIWPAPLLGGSSYTFGLILALALAGIGLGGLAYSRTKRPATMSLFAFTCALEALAIASRTRWRRCATGAPDSAVAKASFGGAVLAWSIVASVVVLPTAFVSGYQFPVVIGLYGRGSKSVARHVGQAYLANTVGSIVGSLSGGFGLLPLLSAPRCWQMVTVLLLQPRSWRSALDLRSRKFSIAAAINLATAAPAALMLFTNGPTVVWRHSGIGGGRADQVTTRQSIEEFRAAVPAEVRWEEDGLESSVALTHQHGFTFIVNGKADGSIIGDAGTQVMSGMLAGLVHGNPKRALVVGLGTGSTAGWLGLVPSIDRVDVVELEPSILRVARDCAVANGAVMNNPKVKITLGDAREVLRTTDGRYDIIFSEPSNPYRAGISSLYTEDFYRSVASRLNDDALFVQWIQSYEVDALAVSTAASRSTGVSHDQRLADARRGSLARRLTLQATSRHQPDERAPPHRTLRDGRAKRLEDDVGRRRACTLPGQCLVRRSPRRTKARPRQHGRPKLPRVRVRAQRREPQTNRY